MVNGAKFCARTRAHFYLFAVILTVTASVATVFLSVLPLIFLSGCTLGTDKNGLFDCFSGEITAEIDFCCNGNESSFILTESGAVRRVRFVSPNELSGFSLCTENGVTKVSYDSLSAEAPSALAVIPNIIGELLKLDDGDLLSVGSAEWEGESVTEAVTRDVTVMFSENGLPIKAEGTLCGVSFSAVFRSFECGGNAEKDGE